VGGKTCDRERAERENRASRSRGLREHLSLGVAAMAEGHLGSREIEERVLDTPVAGERTPRLDGREPSGFEEVVEGRLEEAGQRVGAQSGAR
jgi:hypothetical protein